MQTVQHIHWRMHNQPTNHLNKATRRINEIERQIDLHYRNIPRVQRLQEELALAKKLMPALLWVSKGVIRTDWNEELGMMVPVPHGPQPIEYKLSGRFVANYIRPRGNGVFVFTEQPRTTQDKWILGSKHS